MNNACWWCGEVTTEAACPNVHPDFDLADAYYLKGIEEAVRKKATRRRGPRVWYAHE